MNSPRTYRTEFPDYPAADMPTVPAAWVDISWHNDACPSFMVAGSDHAERLRLWVDFADVAQRENGPDMPRFILQWDNMHSEAGRVVYEGEEWGDALRLAEVERLAWTFTDLVMFELEPAQWAEMRQRNKTVPAGVCASHDFYDTNMTMAEAFEEVTGGPALNLDAPEGEDSMSAATVEMWNAAWQVATVHHLTADDEGGRFDLWRMTGLDVDNLATAGVDDAEGEGRVYAPGHMVRHGDEWLVIVGSEQPSFPVLKDAERYLWAAYASRESR